jgi:hypothetical protein
MIAASPHLIPAATVPNGDLERALTEPLAAGRDEVLYLVCTHPRIKTRDEISPERTIEVVRAKTEGFGSDIGWEQDKWAVLRLPEHVRLSEVRWSIIDPALETIEGLEVSPSFDPALDPEGTEGRHREELLGWIFDRHLEEGWPEAPSHDRGDVQGGFLDFRLEYVGKSGSEALRRPSGAHHKLPLILYRLLVREPHRLLYLFPCELHACKYDPAAESSHVEMRRLKDVCREQQLDRNLLISAAEDMLIAWMGPIHNETGKKGRRFPNSKSAETLRAQGFSEAGIGICGLPPHTRIQGEGEAIEADTPGCKWSLT